MLCVHCGHVTPPPIIAVHDLCMIFFSSDFCHTYSGEHMLRISESAEFPTELVGAWKTMVGPVKDQTSEQRREAG